MTDTDATYYATRILQLAISHPDVDETDEQQLRTYTREMCDTLRLKSEPVEDRVIEIVPRGEPNITTETPNTVGKGFQ